VKLTAAFSIKIENVTKSKRFCSQSASTKRNRLKQKTKLITAAIIQDNKKTFQRKL
jgi:hypothetical protein